ncbi:BrnA antitoxin family protein [Amaricoccus tamworthensis]|uniref:BrnA antitoxin family protein n=1 Tax=Amaricoccus tamworthensis TaxID=57002 RepID=UPI003C7DC065
MTSDDRSPGDLPPLTEREKKVLAEEFGLSLVPPDPANIRIVADARDADGLYRPVKKQVTVRLDADVLAWLKSQGKGYQTRMNEILRREMMAVRDQPEE